MARPFVEQLVPPLIERGVLLVNHVLNAQPGAKERLLAHAGRSVAIEWRAASGGWPTPPSVHARITPAGLLERIDDGVEAIEPAALRMRVELPTPTRLLVMLMVGERPRVDVEGDAQFAADVAWLADHLRWDVEHDLARLVGDVPARFIAQAALSAVQAAGRLARSARSATGAAEAESTTGPQGATAASGAWERRPGAGAASTR